MRDQAIKYTVEEDLAAVLGTESTEIGVTVREGVVTLTGHAPSHAARRRADQIAQHVHGVRAVANDVEVHLPGARLVTDTELARMAMAVIDAVPDLTPGRVWVSVSRGWINLEGEVEADEQLVRIESTVTSLPGVRGVTSRVKIRAAEAAGSPWSY